MDIMGITLIILCLLANINNRQRLYCVSAVLFAQVLHSTFFGQEQNALVYYGSAAMLDVMAYTMVEKIEKGMFSLCLQAVLFCSLLTNTFGYISYQLHLSSEYYNNTINILLVLQSAIMLWGDGGSARFIRNGVRRFMVWSNPSMGNGTAKGQMEETC